MSEDNAITAEKAALLAKEALVGALLGLLVGLPMRLPEIIGNMIDNA